MSEDAVQAAACFGCGQSWLFPEGLPEAARHLFPLDNGVWENPCPACGGIIWITEPMTRAEFNVMREAEG